MSMEACPHEEMFQEMKRIVTGGPGEPGIDTKFQVQKETISSFDKRLKVLMAFNIAIIGLLGGIVTILLNR